MAAWYPFNGVVVAGSSACRWSNLFTGLYAVANKAVLDRPPRRAGLLARAKSRYVASRRQPGELNAAGYGSRGHLQAPVKTRGAASVGDSADAAAADFGRRRQSRLTSPSCRSALPNRYAASFGTQISFQ